MVTRRLFLQDDAAACKCDDCFVVWYKWTLEPLHRGDDFDLYWDETLYCQEVRWVSPTLRLGWP